MGDVQQPAKPVRGRAGDELLRGLAAPGPSKVGVLKAMRARDVSRAEPPEQGRPQSDGGVGRSGSSPVDS
jgi:hypothetical protein